jgi:hypothetical protein
MSVSTLKSSPGLSSSAPKYATRADEVSLHSEVKTITTVREIEAIRENWKCLEGMRDSDIDFYLEFVEASEHVLRPHIIAIYRGGALDALLVGRLEEYDLKLELGYARPKIPTRALVFMDFLRGNDSIENGALLVQSVLEALRRKQAAMALLPAMCDSNFYRAAVDLPGFQSRDHAIRQYPSYKLNLAGGYGGISKRFSQGLRYEIKKKQKKIAADFGTRARFASYSSPNDLEMVASQMEEVAKKTYQRAIGVGFTNDPFMRRRLLLCARMGWLRAFLAYVDDQPCAFALGTVYHGTYLSDFVGHDPKYFQYSFGLTVHNYMIEELCKEGVRMIDFGAGEAEYKRRFSTESGTYAEVRIFAPNFNGLALNAAASGVGALNKSAIWLLNRTKVLPRIKRAWRSLAKPKSQESPPEK